MTGWDFASPLLLVLAPAPLLAAFAPRPRRIAPDGLLVPSALRDRFAAQGGAGARASHFLALAWFAWLSIVVALAGPRVAAATPALPASGRDIMLALDLSGSMTKTDFLLDGAAASRLAVLKRVGSQLIRRRAGDRIGLVIFAENAFAAAPLTFDVEAVGQTLDEMEIGLVGRSTAIGEGLGLALKRLADSKAPTRVIVLLSDGANNAGSSQPAAVAMLAKRLGVKIFTIGLGLHDTSSPGGDPDAVDFFALQKIAEIADGAAFRARTSDELDAAARAIEELAAGETPAPPAIMHRDLWPYPAALAFVAGLAFAFAQRAPR
jgi:Ca-activated chloride channel family protein